MNKARQGFSGENQNIEDLAFHFQLTMDSIQYYKQQVLNQIIVPKILLLPLKNLGIARLELVRVRFIDKKKIKKFL